MFRRVLVANRGEIACRVLATLRERGIESVAVFSKADVGAPHTQLADQAVLIGAAEARDSYLNIEAVLAAALASGAEAIHPGYGFLSENADFAEAVEGAGLSFIGPTPEQVRDFGDKRRSRAIAEKAGVPIIPGYEAADEAGADGASTDGSGADGLDQGADGVAQGEDGLAQGAEELGYPILVKKNHPSQLSRNINSDDGPWIENSLFAGVPSGVCLIRLPFGVAVSLFDTRRAFRQPLPSVRDVAPR